MRRVTPVVLLLMIPLLAVAPGVVRAYSGHSVAPASHKPVRETNKTTCPKKGQKKSTKCSKKPAKKPTPTPTPRKKTKKKTPTPVRRATPRPTATRTPTATPTYTPSATPTITLTPTPVPKTARLPLHSDVPQQYVVAFVVCGLPPGVTASFDPNPVVSQPSPTAPGGGSAQTVMTVSSDWTATPNDYGLEIFALYQNPQGVSAPTPPGGAIQPRAAILHLTDTSASLTAADAVPATNYQGCSPVPASFQPAPVPTSDPGSVKVTSTISDSHPAANESLTATGQITANGQPVYNVPVHFAFYGPRGIPGCDRTTDAYGKASCSWVNSQPLPGYQVLVQITFSYQGRVYTTDTSYVM